MSSSTNTAHKGRKIWEYLCRPDLTEKQLSILGLEGWEMITATFLPQASTFAGYVSAQMHYIFKREVE